MSDNKGPVRRTYGCTGTLAFIGIVAAKTWLSVLGVGAVAAEAYQLLSNDAQGKRAVTISPRRYTSCADRDGDGDFDYVLTLPLPATTYEPGTLEFAFACNQAREGTQFGFHIDTYTFSSTPSSSQRSGL